jgi:uncharacterized protein YlxW (UPF0749 family)
VSSTRTPPHPDEADSLLEGFLAQMIVDDYADVAPSDDRGPRALRRWTTVVLVVAIGLLIATALVDARATADERQQTRTALTDRISGLSASVAERQARLDQQSQEVDRLQQALLTSAVDGEQADRLSALASLAATTSLSGPGVIVTVDDAPDATTGTLNTVLDRDLQDIVNTLWRMGASGIAVNDQRLTDVTAIRSAGDAILVNYVPLTRPYRVTAVGTTTSGEGDSGLQTLLSGLSRDYGLVTDIGSGDVALPAGELRSPRYATTDGGAGQ